MLDLFRRKKKAPAIGVISAAIEVGLEIKCFLLQNPNKIEMEMGNFFLAFLDKEKQLKSICFLNFST